MGYIPFPEVILCTEKPVDPDTSPFLISGIRLVYGITEDIHLGIMIEILKRRKSKTFIFTSFSRFASYFSILRCQNKYYHGFQGLFFSVTE